MCDMSPRWCDARDDVMCTWPPGSTASRGPPPANEPLAIRPYEQLTGRLPRTTSTLESGNRQTHTPGVPHSRRGRRSWSSGVRVDDDDDDVLVGRYRPVASTSLPRHGLGAFEMGNFSVSSRFV